MEVTDQAKAREALTVLGIVFFVEVGLGLLSQAMPTLASALMGSGVDSIMRFWGAQQLLWVLTTGATALAVFMLTRAVREPDLLYALLGALGLLACLELYWAYESFTRTLGESRPAQWMSWISLALGLGVNVGLCVLIGKLGRVMPFAIGIAVYFGVRSLLTAGMRVSESHAPAWAYTVLGLFSIASSIALGALAFSARKQLGSPPPAAAPGPLSGASAEVHAEPGGARLLVTGLLLLLVGIGVTAASFSAASGGGTYVVATGAIATGLVQVVRGLARLGGGKP